MKLESVGSYRLYVRAQRTKAWPEGVLYYDKALIMQPVSLMEERCLKEARCLPYDEVQAVQRKYWK